MVKLETAATDRGVSGVLETMLDRTGYLAELEAERTIEALGRIENLGELVGVARDFDERLDAGDVSGLAGIAGVEEGTEAPRGDGPDASDWFFAWFIPPVTATVFPPLVVVVCINVSLTFGAPAERRESSDSMPTLFSARPPPRERRAASSV